MASSPLVAPASDVLQLSRPAGSPLKRQASASASAVPSSSSGRGTPGLLSARAAAVAPSEPQSLSMTLDPIEQLNEDEKRKYVKGKKLGEGTYANVYLGHVRGDPSALVAIKKIKVQQQYRDGMAPDAVRELKYLRELHHPNIISLLSVFSSKDQNLNLVLEYLPLGDLEMLIRDVDRVRYGAADIKAWMGMLARAVWFCHDNFVLHRDIKPNNLLIAADGEVKLADFGLARSFADPGRRMTANVITRWYRPPELLFGARHYGGAVDIWSVGMVFAELIIRAPFLAGNTEVEQIALICKHIGTPTEDNWPGVTQLREYTVPSEVVPVWGKDAYMGRFGAVGPDGVDLLVRTVALDPKKRITAREMLEHRWWRTDPKPTRKEDLPRKSGGGAEEKMGADLKRRNGLLEDESNSYPRGAKVARKLDFGQAK
ncbi:b96d6744-3349-426a-a6a0-e72b53661a78 [Thermothielavioides terrestris]|uniref:B96d6744-3349-426a-a6a0-e72b53661a78 n=1 Tax=Thermothielavioides terrestris TaxID=2587410 RepID=A0A446BF25_9PEZI|nr:b96d6744-3349-426a-a6a0-e72b53661a78 [Thermothielavioides terrestris]